MKKIIFSGVKPTGKPHIGNYFGAMRQFVSLSKNDSESTGYFMIADYHALNLIQSASEMKENILEVAIDYLAIGLDPEKSVIFKQSDVPAHTELAWIFDTITTMPYLMRAHAFKDAEAKNKEINVGTFNYPMLMASDILLYDTDIVPVGQDQKQHVEYTRDTAEKFNRIFGDTFKMPEAKIFDDISVVLGTDGRKMSKSYKNTIPLFASLDEIKVAVMSIVTDSGSGIPKNVYEIHKLFRSKEDLDKLYTEHEGKYKALKEALISDIETFIKPIRDKKENLLKNIDYVYDVLKNGSEKANKKANEKMNQIKKNIGVI